MSLLDLLSRPEIWEAFYEYKRALICSARDEKQLRAYIDAGAYLPVCQRISRGEALPLPRRAVISKQHSEKKRVVYIYPEPENTVTIGQQSCLPTPHIPTHIYCLSVPPNGNHGRFIAIQGILSGPFPTNS